MNTKKKKVKKRYERWTPLYDKIDNFPFISRYQKKWKKNAVKALDLSEGDKVLDIGTGTGEILPWIVDRLGEGEVIASDISEGMVERARGRLKELENLPEGVDIKVLKDDIESSKFPDDHFDKIIATFTFTTVPHLEKAVSECSRILRPGGKMIILDTGRPDRSYGYLLFYPMMISAKVFGKTHIDRNVKNALAEEFEVQPIQKNMMGMAYTLECRSP